MKRSLLLLILFLSMSMTYAADFRPIGSNAKVCAYTFDGNYYLILSYKVHNNYALLGRPIIKFLLNDGTIIKLDGYDEAVKRTSTSFYWAGVSTVSTKENHFAVLPISKEQIEQFTKGVDKVAINTIPKVYKSEKWSNKKNFGMLLYQDFMGLPDDFEITNDEYEELNPYEARTAPRRQK